MAGIAGLLIRNTSNDLEIMFQKMLGVSRHRRYESYNTVKHNNSHCVIAGAHSFQSPDGDLVVIDRNQDLVFPHWIKDDASISKLFGAIIVIVGDKGLSLIRTPDGTRALYYGFKPSCLAFATERKNLWSVGITDVQSLQPGMVVTQPWDGVIFHKRVATLEEPQKTSATHQETLKFLRRILSASFERIREDTSCAILFSGGVDSSLVATLASNRCNSSILVTSCSEGAHDDSAAIEAAEQIGLPLHTVELNSLVIWETLPEVIYAIETSRQMDVEIALPFYLASKRAMEEGCTTVISGQGPDELFGGYARHVQTFTKKGADALNLQLFQEVSITHKTNIERDERAIAAHGVESFFPYLDWNFVRASLSVPVEWKVSPYRSPQRKIIFRELAQLMGVPSKIAQAPKSATQYSSGSSKALLDSVLHHVDGLKETSRKKASQQVQDVLDEIAYQIGIPNVKRKNEQLKLDMESVSRFLERH